MDCETKKFSIGELTATIGKRLCGSMWVSMESPDGSRFQCNYIGNYLCGPVGKYDFMCDPPQWVLDKLNRKY